MKTEEALALVYVVVLYGHKISWSGSATTEVVGVSHSLSQARTMGEKALVYASRRVDQRLYSYVVQEHYLGEIFGIQPGPTEPAAASPG